MIDRFPLLAQTLHNRRFHVTIQVTGCATAHRQKATGALPKLTTSREKRNRNLGEMDPISVVGVVAAAVQLVDFGARLFNRSMSVYKGASGVESQIVGSQPNLPRPQATITGSQHKTYLYKPPQQSVNGLRGSFARGMPSLRGY